MRAVARPVAVAVAVAGAVLASACANADGGVSATRPAISSLPEQTTTTNPYAVPPVIDAAYVNRVLAGLDAAMGDVMRMVVKAQGMTPEAHKRMEAIFTGAPLSSQINFLIQDSATGFPGLKPSPGNRATTVTRLVSTQSNCVFVQVARDFSGLTINPRSDITEQYVGLRTLDPTNPAKEFNPTGWSIIYDGFQKDRSQPPDPCATEP